MKGLDEALRSMSPEQRRVVEHTHGPVLVVAGAGSGKTRALTYRAANLISQGIEPEGLLISTFTSRATKEFTGRLSSILGEDVKRLKIGTLHSIGGKILRVYGESAGYDPNFLIYDGRDSYNVVRRATASLRIPMEIAPYTNTIAEIGRYKENLINPGEAIRKAATGSNAEVVAQIYQEYQNILAERNAMDFGDLVFNCANLLEVCPEVRTMIGLEHILVDEFQDTDHAQFRMLNLLLDDDKNLMAVGDVDQAIYSFRGADHKIMCDFPKHFPGASLLTLGKNYRCSGTIVSAASRVISYNRNRIKHHIHTDNPNGEPLTLTKAEDEMDEASRIVHKIKDLKGVSYNEIAILYRVNMQSQPIEEELIKCGIPYHVVGSRFFERREILDVILWLRLINNSADEIALNELTERMKKPTEAQVITKLQNLTTSATNDTLPELARRIMLETGIASWYQQRESANSKARGNSSIDNLNRLIAMLNREYAYAALEALPEFLNYLYLMSDDENDDIPRVQLMTLHSAKGTEFDIVFLVGVEENLLPHWRCLKETNNIEASVEEERRLLYVGMTRARKSLHISHAKFRKTASGKELQCNPSRFIMDIPHSLVRRS